MNTYTAYATKIIYRHCLKPLLFQFDPEMVHNMMVNTGKKLGAWKITKWLMKRAWAYESKECTKNIDGISFPNPVGLSAGFDYNGDLVNTIPALGFGFHTIGTVTLQAYDGNAGPRLTRLPGSKGILVNKGLKNIGAKAIIAKLSKVHMSIPLGISIASTNRHYVNEREQIVEIMECFKLFEKSKLKHSYYELNISCPNTFGGEPFTSPTKLKRLLKNLDQLDLSRPVYVKMPIDQSDVETLELLEVLNVHKVQGVIFGNLTKDKSNPDVTPHDRRLWLKMKGNISGTPTLKRSNNCIKLCRSTFGKRFTIIGTGGVFSGEDAAKKIELGADLVQLISGMIYEGPQLAGLVNKHLVYLKPVS